MNVALGALPSNILQVDTTPGTSPSEEPRREGDRRHLLPLQRSTGGSATAEEDAGTTTMTSLEMRLLRAVQTPAELVAQIRTAFSLNISELARVFGVERPTVYAWIAGDATPVVANWNRLREVAGFAAVWLASNNAPIGDRVRRPVASGTSMIELLCQQPIPRGELMTMLEVFRSSTPTVAKGLRARGVPLFETGFGQAEIDRVTGRPLAPEDL